MSPVTSVAVRFKARQVLGNQGHALGGEVDAGQLDRRLALEQRPALAAGGGAGIEHALPGGKVHQACRQAGRSSVLDGDQPSSNPGSSDIGDRASPGSLPSASTVSLRFNVLRPPAALT